MLDINTTVAIYYPLTLTSPGVNFFLALNSEFLTDISDRYILYIYTDIIYTYIPYHIYTQQVY